ncbi:MAG: hypothetical protein L0Z50_36600 [Verrucomicrobiales bacterium]|nr:hypothetical protein [Verrucomicrobiales bacterium]
MDSGTQSRLPGWPIYRDPIDRKLPDPVASNKTDWHPATPATRKLWRCFEAMQKLCFLLKGMGTNEEEATVRRFLVQFAVPLYDFFGCVRDLGATIEGDVQTRDRLNDSEQLYVKDLRKRYREAVLDQITALKAVRDKLGAHTDQDIWPAEAVRLVEGLDIHMTGAYLHAGLLALDKLARLDCFAWSSDGYREGEFRLMTCEPFVLSLRDDKMEMVGFEMTESPRRHIFEKIADAVELSTWMFAEGQGRLVVKRDDADNK